MRLTPVMRTRGTVSILTLAVVLILTGAPAGAGWPSPQGGSAGASGGQAPSDAEVRERAAKLIEKQHEDDAALDVYERTEHYLDRTSGASPHILLDKTYRVIPTGGGTMKLLVSDHGMPADPQEYMRELGTLRGILEMMANPADPRAKTAYDKYQKRQQDRAEFVDVGRTAFVVKLQDRDECKSRTCDDFLL